MSRHPERELTDEIPINRFDADGIYSDMIYYYRELGQDKLYRYIPVANSFAVTYNSCTNGGLARSVALEKEVDHGYLSKSPRDHRAGDGTRRHLRCHGD